MTPRRYRTDRSLIRVQTHQCWLRSLPHANIRVDTYQFAARQRGVEDVAAPLIKHKISD